MAEHNKITSENEHKKDKNLFSFLEDLRINFSPPFIKKETKAEADDNVGKEEGDSKVGDEGDVVKFTDPKPLTPPPLKLEVEECEQNPAGHWMVYALGGFLVLKWIWARWQERKERGGKKEPSDDDESPAADDEDYHSTFNIK